MTSSVKELSTKPGKNRNIVVMGSCSIDYVTYASKLPRPGETVHGHTFATSFGGKGANQCVAAAKLYDKIAMIGRVGDDDSGKKYIDNMKTYGVDVEHLKITGGETTGVAQVMVSENGENQIVIVPGANDRLSVSDVEAARDLITHAGILMCQLETPVEATVHAFKMCQGIKILNAAPAIVGLSRELLSLTTILCVNETEASVLAGLPVERCKGDEVLNELLKLGSEAVVVTTGEDGAMFCSVANPDPRKVRASPVTAADTTGAGDAFLGALAAALLVVADDRFRAAVAAGCFAASRSVTLRGTQTSFVSSSAERLIDEASAP